MFAGCCHLMWAHLQIIPFMLQGKFDMVAVIE
jgi:hypothetical protein